MVIEPPHASRNCPFCRDNGLLKSAVIAESPHAYLIESSSLGNYLIIPNAHVEVPSDLSDTWWADVKELLGHTPDVSSSYNLSFNYGQDAGQTVSHVHFWVVPRIAKKHSSGKGLVGLMSVVDHL